MKDHDVRDLLTARYPQLELQVPGTRMEKLFAGHPHCPHLEKNREGHALAPDIIYVGHEAREQATRPQPRPEIRVCTDCLMTVWREEWNAYQGVVVAFEPDFSKRRQYFCTALPDMTDVDFTSADVDFVSGLFPSPDDRCADCEDELAWARWVPLDGFLSRKPRAGFDASRTQFLCRPHLLAKIEARIRAAGPDFHLHYVNMPYGTRAVYTTEEKL